MNQHAWIAAVLDDMIDYARRNDMGEIGSELTLTAERIAPLLDRAGTADPGEGPCDVIPLPARRA